MTRSSRHRGRSGRFRHVPVRHGINWRRALLLVPVLLGLLVVSLVEHGDLAYGKVGPAAIVAALKDPLSLFAERSPGVRGAGTLLSTKGPHERVLSTVRDREPFYDIPSAVEGPAAPVLSALPQDGILPADQLLGSFPWPPPYYGGPWPGGPGTGPLPPPPVTPPVTPPPVTPPPVTPPPVTPPVTTGVPEPATWLMMIFGLFAVMAMGCRRVNALPGSLTKSV